MFKKAMLNKTAIPIVFIGLMFSATANAKTQALALTEDTAIFSNIGLKANSLVNDFFTFSTPTADSGTVGNANGISSFRAAMQPSLPIPDPSLNNGSGFSTVNASVSETPSSSWSAGDAAYRSNPTLTATSETGSDSWPMMVIGVGLVAFRLRRRPGINIFSYS